MKVISSDPIGSLALANMRSYIESDKVKGDIIYQGRTYGVIKPEPADSGYGLYVFRQADWRRLVRRNDPDEKYEIPFKDC